MWNFPIAPEQASEFAPEYDRLFWMTTALTVFFTLVVGVGIIVLAIRYRKGNKVNRHNPADTHMGLEITWSVIPLVLGLVMFFWAAKLFVDTRTPPKDAMEFFVIGKQWMWHIQHPSGVRENSTLHIPVGKPIKLTMISQDVIHSFFIPQFRIKQDVLPGRYTTQWFTPTKIGRFNLFCTEYCGTQHSEMGGYVYVMSQADYQKWLESGGDLRPEHEGTPEVQGKLVYDELSCGNCHTATDTPRGPSLYGLYGRNRRMTDGKIYRATPEYIREAIVDPYRKINEGYEKTMPTYDPKGGLVSEADIVNLIAYIRSLGTSAEPTGPDDATGAAANPAVTGAVR